MIKNKYAATSPSRRTPMTWSFAFSSPAHVLASFFGSGVLTPASGTWGTAAGLLVFMALEDMPLALWCVLLVLTFILGAWACERTGRDLRVHDHTSIVIDEVCAIWLVALTVPATLAWQIAAFLTFRFFDITKVPPAGYFDSAPSWQNGLGVMLDDLVAALQSILVLKIASIFV